MRVLLIASTAAVIAAASPAFAHGSQLDPDGRAAPCDRGGMIDPNGCPADAAKSYGIDPNGRGVGMDPDGRFGDQGSAIDPNGRDAGGFWAWLLRLIGRG